MASCFRGRSIVITSPFLSKHCEKHQRVLHRAPLVLGGGAVGPDIFIDRLFSVVGATGDVVVAVGPTARRRLFGPMVTACRVELPFAHRLG